MPFKHKHVGWLATLFRRTIMIHIKTNRLILRDWLSSDIDLMSEISASKVVMEYFPAISSVD